MCLVTETLSQVKGRCTVALEGLKNNRRSCEKLNSFRDICPGDYAASKIVGQEEGGIVHPPPPEINL